MNVREALEELAVTTYSEAGPQGGEVRRLVFDVDRLVTIIELAFRGSYIEGYNDWYSMGDLDCDNGVTAGVAVITREK